MKKLNQLAVVKKSHDRGFWPWLREEAKSTYFRLSVIAISLQGVSQLLSSLVRKGDESPLSKVVGQSILPWLPAIGYAYQTSIIAVLIYVIQRTNLADLRGNSRSRQNSISLQKAFWNQWKMIWWTWLLLYLGYFSFSVIKQVQIQTIQNSVRDHAIGQFVKYHRIMANHESGKHGITFLPDSDAFHQAIESHVLCPDEQKVTGVGTETKNSLSESSSKEEKSGNNLANGKSLNHSAVSLGIHDLPFMIRNEAQERSLRAMAFRLFSSKSDTSGNSTKSDQKDFPGARGKDSARPNEIDSFIEFYHLLDRLKLTRLIESVILNLLNNLQTVQVILCFLILTYRNTDILERVSKPLYTGVLVFSICELICSFTLSMDANAIAHDIIDWLSSIAGGMALAMLFGKLGSRLLEAPVWLTVSLYAYALMQIRNGIGESNAFSIVFLSLIYFNYSLFKILLFLFVSWICRSGRLLYYLEYSARHGSIDTDRIEFLARDVLVDRSTDPI